MRERGVTFTVTNEPNELMWTQRIDCILGEPHLALLDGDKQGREKRVKRKQYICNRKCIEKKMDSYQG